MITFNHNRGQHIAAIALTCRPICVGCATRRISGTSSNGSWRLSTSDRRSAICRHRDHRRGRRYQTTARLAAKPLAQLAASM
jgi:hypothetical protein